MRSKKQTKKAAKQQRGSRTVKLNQETVEILHSRREAFIAKFGRPPGPNDPVFFDPDADTPRPISEETLISFTLEAMESAGLPPQYIHAYKKTGLILTEANASLAHPDDRLEWEEAVREYFESEAARRSIPPGYKT
jgi:hypothetical protein